MNDWGKKYRSFPSLMTPNSTSPVSRQTNHPFWDWPTATLPPQLLRGHCHPLGPISRFICSWVLSLPAAEHTSMLAVTQRLDNPFPGPFWTLSVSRASVCPWSLGQWTLNACLPCAEVCSPVKTRVIGDGVLAESQILQSHFLVA